MVQEGPSDTTRPPAEGRRLGGGAIAALTIATLRVTELVLAIDLGRGTLW